MSVDCDKIEASKRAEFERGREERLFALLERIATSLEELTAWKCGHGEIRWTCPYFHPEGE